MSEAIVNGDVIGLKYSTTTAVIFSVDDYRTLPASTIRKFLTAGVAHVFGNEVASRVTAWKKKSAEENAGVEPSAEAVAEERMRLLTECAEDALSGELGTGRATGPRGPRLTEFQALVRDIAYVEVGEELAKDRGAGPILVKNPAGRYVWPSTSKEPGFTKDVLVKIGGQDFTYAQLVERRITNPTHGPRIEGVAKKRLEDQAKQLAKAAAAPDASLEDVL